jgi:hypothetical protein
MIEFGLHYQYEVKELVAVALDKESSAVAMEALGHLLDVFVVV